MRRVMLDFAAEKTIMHCRTLRVKRPMSPFCWLLAALLAGVWNGPALSRADDNLFGYSAVPHSDLLPGRKSAAAANGSDAFSRQWLPEGKTARSSVFAAQEGGIRQAGFQTYRPVAVGQVFGSESPFPTVRLTGFFQADAGWVHQSEANRTAVGDAQDGADFRRARLQAVGHVWENVRYSVEFDFAFPGRPSFMDVWLEVEDVLAGGHLRIGQYRQPIGMDGLTSVRELTFLERALPFALLPFRQIGAMLHGTTADEAGTWAFSVFRFPTDVFGGNVGDNGGYGFATRLTRLLLDDGDDALVHLGGAFTVFDPANDLVRYRNQPEFFVTETGGAAFVPAGVPATTPAFVDTGLIATNTVSLFGAEAAARFGAWHLESELIYALVDQQRAGTAAFPGLYVQAGYILTGEVRPYNRKAGVLGRIVPRHPFRRGGGKGAWEIAARWSYLDLNDAGVRGGRLNDITIGLNWYLNRFTKFQLNYIHAFLDSPVNGNSDAGIVAARAQLDF